MTASSVLQRQHSKADEGKSRSNQTAESNSDNAQQTQASAPSAPSAAPTAATEQQEEQVIARRGAPSLVERMRARLERMESRSRNNSESDIQMTDDAPVPRQRSWSLPDASTAHIAYFLRNLGDELDSAMSSTTMLSEATTSEQSEQ